MTHAFTQNVIDLSKAEIVRIETSKSNLSEFEAFISNQDKFSDT